MQENSNRALAINSLILYVRLGIVSICGLLYTRFGLEALGVDDFGLFSVISGIISFIAIVNTIMIATSNRFMAIAIGKGDNVMANQTFNVNLSVHVLIAILTLVLSFPLGHWYIGHFVNYTGNFAYVYAVYDISITASIVSFIGVPYNGLLLAKERFFVFCSTDVLSSIVKLLFTYLLIDHFDNKLILFTLATSTFTAYPTLVFSVYCHKKFREITRICFVKDWKQYYDVLRFSANMSIGAIAYVAKVQGSAMVVNIFFSTMMNSALAIANSVNNILSLFANNIQKSISPQIVKSYAANDVERSMKLVCTSSKLTYIVMLMVSIPFLVTPETIFGLWLKETPEYTIQFTRLLIVDVLIMSLNAGVPDLVFATGKIRKYQLIVNGLLCTSVIVGYMLLKHGYRAELLFYSYITFSILVFVARPLLLSQVIDFKIRDLAGDVYLPSCLTTLMLMPVFLLKDSMNGWVLLVITEVYYFILVLLIGLTESERTILIRTITNKIQRK